MENEGTSHHPIKKYIERNYLDFLGCFGGVIWAAGFCCECAKVMDLGFFDRPFLLFGFLFFTGFHL
jgi:hypothetical protein